MCGQMRNSFVALSVLLFPVDVYPMPRSSVVVRTVSSKLREKIRSNAKVWMINEANIVATATDKIKTHKKRLTHQK